MSKIFCIGYPKTGTTSLESALEGLGYKVCRGDFRNNHTNYLIALYVNGDFDELFRIIDYFDAFADLPWGASDLYRRLSTRYPDARFILTTRDADDWHRSVVNATRELDPNPGTALASYHAAGGYGAVYFFSRVLGIDSLDGTREQLIERYNTHNREASAFFGTSPRFLQLELTSKPSWDGLCRFLQRKPPDTPFPHENPASV